MNTSFPATTLKKDFLKPADFQDKEVTLTYAGWEKKGNTGEDWKKNLKYQLRYSYPEFATDEHGDKRIGKDGNPWKNMYYDKEYPHGYSIVYRFAEGQLESGSLPLWNAFCAAQPKPGDKVMLKRTGEAKDTEWTVEVVINLDEKAPF